MPVFSAQRGESDERCKDFEVTLYWLHDSLGHWDDLSASYWSRKNADQRQQFAQQANDLAREIVERLRRNAELRRELVEKQLARPGMLDLSEPNVAFNEVCWTVAENIIVGLESMWDGRPDFVDAAWSLFALTRDLPAPEAAPGMLKTLAESWLDEIFRRWKDETKDGTKPGPMDATLKRARALVDRIEKLQKLLDDDKAKPKQVQQQLDNLVKEAADIAEDFSKEEGQGRGFGRPTPLREAFGPGLSAILNEAIRGTGEFIEPAIYGRPSPPQIAPPGVGPGEGAGGISPGRGAEPPPSPDQNDPKDPEPRRER